MGLAEALRTYLPLRGGVLLRYGNPRGKDIDLVAIVREPTEFLAWRLGRIDLFAVNWEECERRLLVWDPMVTEPVQTGILLAGSTRNFRRLQNYLHRRPGARLATTYLVWKALEHAACARSWLKRVRATRRPRDAEVVLANLTFCCSYALRAHELSTGKEVMEPSTFREQQAQSPLLRRARQLLAVAKHGTMPPVRALQDLMLDVETNLVLGKLELSGK